ncbi:uncharacterized protein LOC134769941 isoform X2 [Penaeus indicus]|uniref:uncharacterized protein LOC134769941 isoform X2 n=1 Tax=Penaeus indicus TaxID=29960 RepID=UPI00300D6E98
MAVSPLPDWMPFLINRVSAAAVTSPTTPAFDFSRRYVVFSGSRNAGDSKVLVGSFPREAISLSLKATGMDHYIIVQGTRNVQKEEPSVEDSRTVLTTKRGCRRRASRVVAGRSPLGREPLLVTPA